MRFRIYFALLGALLIQKELLIANGHLVGTGLEESLGDTSSYIAGIQTATVEVNLIHKARYSDQLSCANMHLSERSK